MNRYTALLGVLLPLSCLTQVPPMKQKDATTDLDETDVSLSDDAGSGVTDTPGVQDDEGSIGDAGRVVDRDVQAIEVQVEIVFNGIVPTTPLPQDPAISVRRSSDGGCLLTRSGAVWCWNGRLPRFEGLPVTGAPTRVADLPAIRQFAGQGPWAGIDEAGMVWVWSAPAGGRSLTCAGWIPYPLRTTRRDYPEPVRWSDGWLWLTEGGAVRRSHPDWAHSVCEEHPTYWQGGVTSASSSLLGSPYCVTTERGTVECLDEMNNTESRARIRWLFQTRPIGRTATVLEGISDAIVVDLELDHQCVLLRSGRVLCWGRVEHDFTEPERCEFPWEPWSGLVACRRRPTEVPGIDDAVKIDIQFQQSCALRRSGEVWCWGRDGGSLGLDGSSRDPSTPECGSACTRRPERVVGLREAIDFSISGFVPTGWCAVVRSGRVYCRGMCVGDGTCDPHDRPVEVRWE